MLALFLAAAPLVAAPDFTSDFVPEFRGWEGTSFAGWNDFSNVNAASTAAFPDDAATTTTGIRLESTQPGAFTVSGGTLCITNSDRFGVRYNGAGLGRVREVVIQINAVGAHDAQVFLLYPSNGELAAMVAAETRQLGPDEFMARFLLAPDGPTFGTSSPTQRFVLETAIPLVGGQLCVEALRVDIRHALDTEFYPMCSSAPNSIDLVGGLDLGGSSDAVDNDFYLTASGVPSGTFGLFLTSQTAAVTPCPLGCAATMGTLCLGGDVARIGPPLRAEFGLSYRAQLDLNAIPLTPAVAATAGSTWYFQAWYRDRDPGSTSNFSQAAAIVFR